MRYLFLLFLLFSVTARAGDYYVCGKFSGGSAAASCEAAYADFYATTNINHAIMTFNGVDSSGACSYNVKMVFNTETYSVCKPTLMNCPVGQTYSNGSCSYASSSSSSSSSSSAASSARCNYQGGVTTAWVPPSSVGYYCSSNNCVMAVGRCTYAGGKIGSSISWSWCQLTETKQSCDKPTTFGSPSSADLYPDSSSAASSASASASASSSGAASSSGSTSSAATSAAGSSVDKCPECTCIQKGLGYAAFNGVGACVDPAQSNKPIVSTDSKTTTATASDGTTTSTSQSTTTTCGGGNCTATTTTTTTGADGKASTTTTTGTGASGDAAQKQSFCAENPSLQICKQSTVSGGGDCQTAPACSGDAVQCATLTQAWKTRCAFDVPDSVKADYQKMVDAGRTPSNHPGASANRDSVDVGNLFSGVSETFVAACLPDINFTLAGSAIHIPMTEACRWFSIAGTIGVMVSIVLGIIIIVR